MAHTTPSHILAVVGARPNFIKMSSLVSELKKMESVRVTLLHTGQQYYFDTAPDYSEAGAEERFGVAMKGVRDEMFVATKFCRPTGHLAEGSSIEDYVEAVNGSLRRLVIIDGYRAAQA